MKSLASDLLKTENQLVTPRDFKGTEQHYASPGANEVPTVSTKISIRFTVQGTMVASPKDAEPAVCVGYVESEHHAASSTKIVFEIHYGR